MKLNTIITPLMIALTLQLTACGLADLRPDTLVEGTATVSDEDRARGRELLQAMADAHGGEEAWKAHGSTTMDMTDTWPVLPARLLVMPWGKDGQAMRVTSVNGVDRVRLEQLDGPDAGLVWGVQDGRTYTVEPGSDAPRFHEEKDGEIAFWTLATQYFYEAPFRLDEGDVIYYLGEAEVEGKVYDRVFVSWKTDAPQEDTDQYIAWIERDTHRLGYLQFTIRYFFDAARGSLAYKDYQEHDGVLVPGRIEAGGEPGENSPGHILEVQAVEFGETKALVSGR